MDAADVTDVMDPLNESTKHRILVEPRLHPLQSTSSPMSVSIVFPCQSEIFDFIINSTKKQKTVALINVRAIDWLLDK